MSYKDTTQIQLIKSARTLINEEELKSKVFNIITKYIKGLKLGDTIDIRYLNNEIEKIDELLEFKTVRTDLGDSVPGLSFCLFNPIYNGKDIRFIDTRWKLKPFQIPYIENEREFKDKIKVKSVITNKSVVEY